MHEVLVTNEGEAVRGCPNYVRSMPNSKKDYEGIEPCAVGSTVEVPPPPPPQSPTTFHNLLTYYSGAYSFVAICLTLFLWEIFEALYGSCHRLSSVQQGQDSGGATAPHVYHCNVPALPRSWPLSN